MKIGSVLAELWTTYFLKSENGKSCFGRTSGLNFRFLYKNGNDRKVNAVQPKKRNFENRFINSKVNVDYLGGGEVRSG